MKPWEIIALCFILILTFLIRIPFLAEPFETDQGIYSYLAWGWEHGKVLYRDLVDNKPPLVFVFYRIIFKLFGYSVQDIHLTYSLLAVLTTFVFYWLARSIFKPGIALISAFLYGLFSGGALIAGSFANAENLMVLFIIFAFYCFWRAYQERKNFLFVFGGIFIGLAAMTKQSGLFEGMGISLFLYFVFGDKGNRALALKRISLVWLGMGMVFAFIWVCLVRSGLEKDFIQSTIRYGLFYSRAAGVQQSTINFLHALKWTPRENFPLWILGGWGAILAFKKKEKLFLFLAIWMIFAFLGVAVSGRFYHQYFIQFIPPLVLVATYTLQTLFWQKESGKRKRLIGALALIAAIGIFFGAQWNYYFKYSPTDSLIHRRGSLVRPDLVRGTNQLVSYIRERTKPDEYIYIWGLWPEVYFLSQRYASSKYAFLASRGIMIKWFKSLVQEQVWQDTAKNNPKFFIIDYYFADLISPDLNKYLRENYVYDTKIAGCEVLVRR